MRLFSTMSPSSTPTDLFQHLSLNPQMSPTSEVVKSRAAELRDVLSSFDREILPAEYRPDVFDRLDRPLGLRPQMQSEWTVQQDLPATLLQWGAYNEEAFQFIKSIQPLQTRTRLFHEKLSRRFQDIFHHYDVLHGTATTSQEAHDHVQALAERFLAVINAIFQDRQYREVGQPRTAELVLGALLGVCQRHNDIMLSDFTSPGVERSGGTPELSRSDTSLFQALIRDSDESQKGYLLVLDLLESYTPAILGQQAAEFEELVDLLNDNGAPKAYINRVTRLLAIAIEHAPPEPTGEGGDEEEGESSSGMASVTPATGRIVRRTASTRKAKGREAGPPAGEARTGAKRSAATEGTSKRGRKKTSK